MMNLLSHFRLNFSGDGLRALALRGSVWTFIGFGAENILRLGSNLILTRLLAPEMFGLMALAMVFLQGLEMMSDIGTKASIIRSDRGDDIHFLQTAWTVQVIRGGCICVATCFLAWPASLIYEQPILFPLLSVLSLTALISGFISISKSILGRKILLAKLTIVSLAVQVTTIVFTVLFAWILESVWALAIGVLLGRFLNLILSHTVLPPFKHRFRLEADALKELFVFGRWILLGTFFTFLGGRGLQTINGILVPIEILGLISIAGFMAWAPGNLVGKLLGNIAFPLFSKTRRENISNLGNVVRKVRILLITLTLPAFLLLSFIAQDLINFLYDDRYAEAGEFLAIMALNGMVGVLPMPYQNLMLAVGNSRMHAMIMGYSAAMRITGLLLGFHIGGVPGMLAGIGAGTFFVYLLSARFAWKHGYAGLALDGGTLFVLGISYYNLFSHG